jgi:hypothetical protein
VREAPVDFGQRAEAAGEGGVKWHAAPHRGEDAECRAAGSESAVGQSSIPLVGEEGMATSRRGIRPAR